MSLTLTPAVEADLDQSGLHCADIASIIIGPRGNLTGAQKTRLILAAYEWGRTVAFRDPEGTLPSYNEVREWIEGHIVEWSDR